MESALIDLFAPKNVAPREAPTAAVAADDRSAPDRNAAPQVPLEELLEPRRATARKLRTKADPHEWSRSRPMPPLSDATDVAPVQFEQIKKLRADYYKYLDELLEYHRQLPVLMWLLQSIRNIIDRGPRVLDDAFAEMDELTDRAEMDKTLDKRMREMRRGINMPETNEFLDAIDAIDSLLHIRVQKTIGSYHSRRYKPEPATLEEMAKRFSARRAKDLIRKTQTLLDPADEWELVHAMNVSVRGTPADQAGSGPREVDKNAQQLAADSYTLGGMRRNVANVRDELMQFRTTYEQLTVKIVQFTELAQSLERSGRITAEALEAIAKCGRLAASFTTLSE